MPGVSQNVTNEASDLVIRGPYGDIPLMLYRPKKKDGGLGSFNFSRQFGPSETDKMLQFRDVPLLWDDFSAGACISRPFGLLKGYSEAANMCLRHPGVVTPGGLVTQVPLPAGLAGQITAVTEFFGDTYFACNRYLLRSLGGTANPEIVADLGAGFLTDSLVAFDNALWIGGYGGNLKKFDGATLTTSADIAPGKLVTVQWYLGGDLAAGLPGSMTAGQHYTVMIGTTGDFASTGIRFVPSNSNPLLAANWRSAIPVGNVASPIARIVASNGHAYFTKGGADGGVFDMDETGRTPNLAHLFRDNQVGSNGTAAYVYDGGLFVSFGFGTVEIPLGDTTRQDVPGECGVGYGLPNESSLHGWALDMVNVDGWLAQSVWSPLTGGSKIMFGRRRSRLGIPGPGSMVWHGAEVDLPGIEINRLYAASPGGAPRLWMPGVRASDSAVVLYWLSLPQAATPFEDLLLGGPMRFAQTGSVTMTTGTWGQVDQLKNIDRWVLNVDNLGYGNILTLAADSDGGILKTYVDQGQARDRKRTRMLASGAAASGYEITPQITYAGTTTHPALFRSLRGDASLVLEQTPLLTYPVMIGKGVLDRAGNPIRDYDNTEVIKSQLYDLQGRGRLQMTDHRGRVLTARFEGGMSETVEEHPDGAGYVTVLTLRASILAQLAYYDASSYYDEWDLYG